MPSSLSSIYSDLAAAERDQMEKAAAAHAAAETETDMVKVAAAYDEMGRAMARQYIDDMVKAAQEEAEAPAEGLPPGAEASPEEPEEEELARRKAEILARLQAEEAGAEEMPPEAAAAPPPA